MNSDVAFVPIDTRLDEADAARFMDGVRGRGAPVTYLTHAASFHSIERITPSNRGIKHLGLLL